MRAGGGAEAQAYHHCCTTEVGFDVHRLDGDKDGVACEALPRPSCWLASRAGWRRRSQTDNQTPHRTGAKERETAGIRPDRP